MPVNPHFRKCESSIVKLRSEIEAGESPVERAIQAIEARRPAKDAVLAVLATAKASVNAISEYIAITYNSRLAKWLSTGSLENVSSYQEATGSWLSCTSSTNTGVQNTVNYPCTTYNNRQYYTFPDVKYVITPPFCKEKMCRIPHCPWN